MASILAYLDPGTGSVLLQALLGGIAGLAVGLKLFGRRMLSFLGLGRFIKDDEPETVTKATATPKATTKPEADPN